MGRGILLLAVVFIFFCKPVLASREGDLNCLTRAVYHESRGESFLGQLAVANVIMNRVRSGHYPENICDVVYQPNQFTNLSPDEKINDLTAWRVAKTAAIISYDHSLSDPTNGALFFYAHHKVRPLWKKTKIVLVEGNHTFLVLNEK